MTYYTYLHTRNDTGKVFYIGKGQGKRCYNKKSRNKWWKHIESKAGRTVEILAYWNTNKEACEHERLLIACFRDMGYELVNICDGGEGNGLPGKLNGMYGKTHSEEARAKQRARRLSQVFNEETFYKISVANTGAGNGMYGVKRPEVAERSNEQVTCPHCNKTGQFLAMRRWHFNKCPKT